MVTCLGTPVLAPRIYVALARYADQCPDGGSLAAAVGIAPVTDQSGKMKKIYRRFRCDTFTLPAGFIFIRWRDYCTSMSSAQAGHSIT